MSVNDLPWWGVLLLFAIVGGFVVLISRGGQEISRHAAECRSAGGEYFYAKGAEICIDKKHVIDIREDR